MQRQKLFIKINIMININLISQLARIFSRITVFSIICFYSCFNTNPKTGSNQSIPIVDLTKDYPEKEFVVDEADMEYIPLETTTEVLTDRDFSIVFVSDNHIVGMNRQRGDIFIFGRDGKVISFFNHKGNSGIEYRYISSIVFDEVKKEIFVTDQNRNRCAVFSADGNFLRQFNFPANSWIRNLYNFDDETLLAYNQDRVGVSYEGDNNMNQKMPYVFLSKSDGSLISRLNLSFSKRVSDTQITNNSSSGMSGITITSPNQNVKFGDEFVIADRSSDTVFLLTQDKKLSPLFVRKPSAFGDENRTIIMSVHFKTDKYLFFLTYLLDWNEVKRQSEKGEQYRPAIRPFAYDLHTGEVYKPVGREPVGFLTDAPKNACVGIYSADNLVDRLKKGRLGGKIKEVAQTLKEEDNDVVEIIKYQER